MGGSSTAVRTAVRGTRAEEWPDVTLEDVQAEFSHLFIEIPPGCVSLCLAYQRWSLAPSFAGETALILRGQTSRLPERSNVMPGLTMEYFRTHWGDVYAFAEQNGQYTAREKFGHHEELAADTPEQLLTKIRRHYRGPRSERSST
jgi:hypothetical protein